jgi:hypothetical protein
MVDALKEELDLASQGNEEAKKMLIEIGIDDSISSTSSRDLLAHALYLSQGPHPIDGYQLYFAKTDHNVTINAASYYKSSYVSTYVEEFCPKRSRAD